MADKQHGLYKGHQVLPDSLMDDLEKAKISDVQGFVNPPRVRGKGQGQGKDFMILNKPLTLVKGQGFFKGFSGVSFL